MVCCLPLLGRPLPPGWSKTLTTRLIAVLTQEAEPIAGAVEALQGVTALGVLGGSMRTDADAVLELAEVPPALVALIVTLVEPVELGVPTIETVLEFTPAQDGTPEAAT